jgi:DNA polymerase-3 subunit beta
MEQGSGLFFPKGENSTNLKFAPKGYFCFCPQAAFPPYGKCGNTRYVHPNFMKMNFSAPSSDLLKRLQMVAGAIGSMNVLPILEDFLFTIDNGQLTISSSDLETSITTQMQVMSDANGSIAVPAKILLDTLKALPGQPITFSVNEDNQGIEITSAYGKYRLAGENGGDFPSIPSPEDGEDFVMLPAQKLSRAIANTLFATSNDELRPQMNGAYFQIDFKKVTVVATDAHKLVRYAMSPVACDVATSFIVPKKALNLLKNILPASEDIRIAFNKANAFFSWQDTQLVCRLVDARYPDYNAVIPVDNPNTLTINRLDFLNSLRRSAIYANKTTNQVILNLAENSMTISAQDLDFSNEATEQLACTYTGSPMQIAFNAKFFIEMLSVLESDEVQVRLSTPTRAGILLPGEPVEGEDILMLVMPVMLGK